MSDPQRLAADPRASAFVTANAGSGKTKTLVDRVTRLLLAGAAPEAILCVSFTKAAAAEMQGRLFQQLGEWSVMDDLELEERLQELDGDVGPRRDLSRARALFARALETPGGLKIQTIHAFCEKLLRRFPLEADVSPGFQVMDDAEAAAIAGEARAAVARFALHGDGAVAEAYARLSVALAFDDFQAMFRAFEDRRAAVGAYVERCGGVAGAAADAWRRCGFGAPESVEAIEAQAMADLDPALYRAAAAVLAASGGKRDGEYAAALGAVVEGDASLADALGALFTADGQGEPRAWVRTAVALRAREDLREALLAEQGRLAAARERVRAAKVAADTVDALVLAQAYVTAYTHAKRMRGALDFADLIGKAFALLGEKADAAWVLYKLDGGVDHILVDEAQDTSPEQWAIVRALTDEFFAGAGATRVGGAGLRTLFVVGDEKQSIFSFQGAEPELLRLETEAYVERIAAVGQRALAVTLAQSFRATPHILRFVDGVFAEPALWRGVPAARGEAVVRHTAIRIGHAGAIDLWPLLREEAGEAHGAWDDPLDQEGPRSANRRLADAIAVEIQGLIGRGEAVFDKTARRWRPAHAGDVLILVRRRRALFEEILRALKRRGVPVAGADRLSLSEHILFQDLLALGRFIQFPHDDLTLAGLLKSPLCGLDDASLFALAHGRDGSLWRALGARAGERDAWRAAHHLLTRAIGEARRRRPFDFYARLLGWTDEAGRSLRARILTRLGGEAQDVLDEFLAQVLSAERGGVADLERLVQAFGALDRTVKREMEGARDEVRVMTVHGAKGLEAPIVFLPETTLKRGARGSPLMQTPDGGFLWCASAKQDCAASAEARAWLAEREDHEGQRLFYVALTRARDRLIVCGRIAAGAKAENVGGWYAAAEAALARPEIVDQVRAAQVQGMEARRFGPDPVCLPLEARKAAASAPLPAWALDAAPPEAAERFASPSRLGEDEPDIGAAPSPLERSGGLGRYRRGDLIHRLLQLLPDLPVETRIVAAERLMAREVDLTHAQRREIAAAALGVLDDPRFAAVFAPGSRAEAAIAGRAPGVGAAAGRVDRLLVEPHRVLVADFKTNRPSPARIEDADPAYIRQMAAYVAVLRAIFPDRPVEAALIWTDGPKLMPIPEKLLAAALAQLG